MITTNLFGDKKFVDHKTAAGEIPPITAIKFEYLLAGNGLFIRAKRKEFSVCLPLYQGIISGLPPVQSGITWHQKRIPDNFWQEIWQNARSSSDYLEFREDVFVIYLNARSGEWQWRKVSRERRFASTIADDTGEEYAQACLEIHTHPPGAVYFSSLDDRDESGKFRLFGILVDVHSATPKIRFRCGVYEYFVPICANEISEIPLEMIDLNLLEQKSDNKL